MQQKRNTQARRILLGQHRLLKDSSIISGGRKHLHGASAESRAVSSAFDVLITTREEAPWKINSMAQAGGVNRQNRGGGLCECWESKSILRKDKRTVMSMMVSERGKGSGPCYLIIRQEAHACISRKCLPW